MCYPTHTHTHTLTQIWSLDHYIYMLMHWFLKLPFCTHLEAAALKPANPGIGSFAPLRRIQRCSFPPFIFGPHFLTNLVIGYHIYFFNLSFGYPKSVSKIHIYRSRWWWGIPMKQEQRPPGAILRWVKVCHVNYSLHKDMGISPIAFVNEWVFFRLSFLCSIVEWIYILWEWVWYIFFNLRHRVICWWCSVLKWG